MEQREYERGRREKRLQNKKSKRSRKEEQEEFFEKCEFDTRKCVNCRFYSQCYDLEMTKDICFEEQ